MLENRKSNMCGIAGIKALNGDHNVADDLIKMLNAIKHRGPDGSGVFVDGKIVKDSLENLDSPKGSFGMGHNLLSIVGTDVSQPIKKHGLILVANAEIYNFRDLKNCIEDDFETDSDCEVIISVVNKFYNGSLLEAVKKSLPNLDGDYAFAIYDGKDCVVVRDPFGIKPVYYGKDNLNGLFAFASEKKALWNIGLKHVETLAPDHILLNGETIKLDNRKNIILKRDKSCSIANSDILNRRSFLAEYLKINKHNINYHENYKIEKDKKKFKDELMELLINSVEKRINGLSKVGHNLFWWS